MPTPSAATPSDVLRQAKTVGHEVMVLRDTARDAAKNVAKRIDVRAYVNAHPYRAVGIALGIGYVLGGGLFSRLTARLIRLSARVVIAPALRGEVASIFGTDERDFANVRVDERSVQ